MDIKELVRKNSSYRRFHQDVRIDIETLRQLTDLARFSGSGANLQSLKYMLCVDPETNDAVFPHLAWAGYMKYWRDEWGIHHVPKRSLDELITKRRGL